MAICNAVESGLQGFTVSAGTCHWSLSVSEGIITTACFTFPAEPVPAAVMVPTAAVCTSFHEPSAHVLFRLERSAPSHFRGRGF
eukprot:s244_g21.t1